MQQQVLGGRYLIKDKVGSGGMATVYRAQDQVLDRTVAIKIMLPQYAADATFAARFKQEAQAAAGLQSPYIVGIYDWGKDGDTYYIVMEYLRGTDLKSGIRSHGALDPKKVAQIGSQICAALSVAHKHEIIHRDIKPQNIMVLPDGNIKVMDFGIARAKNSHLTQDNNVLGTAHYVSPEQARGQELGPTSDIYSLGVVMYECATGQVPFDGEDAISVAVKQMNELPVPPSQLNPAIDANLERIILRCMEKDPANRFQSADELRQALNAYLAGRQVDVPEPTRVLAAGAIGGVGGAGTTETRVMTDKTQAMARPADLGATTVRGGAGGRSSVSGGQGSYEPEPKRGRGAKIAAAIIGAIAVIGVIAFIAMNALGAGGEEFPAPNLLGMTQQQAEDELEKYGLELGNIDPGYSDDYEVGEIMDQTPGEGRSVHKGDKIDITIVRGPETKTTTVPSLSGCTQEEAEQLLKEAGLTGHPVTEANDAEEGKVFDQNPAAGEEVDEGSTVTYKVSTGPDAENIPGVVGYTEAEATNMLSEAGFSVNSVSGGYSSRYAAGYVMSQDPTGQAKPGSTVTIYISEGPEPEPEPEPDTPDSPASPTSPESPTTGEGEETS